MAGKRKLIKKLLLVCLILFVIAVGYGWQDFKTGWESYDCECDHKQQKTDNTSEV